MAPRTRNSDKKHSRSRRKEVRFPRREIAARKSATVIKPPANYENLILYYLTKLKRLFSAPNHPHPRSSENSADKMRREQLEKRCSEAKSKIEIDPNKYTARRSTPKPREDVKDIEQDIRDKVYNVVNAAIEYGFANNVLEKKGDCFVFKNKKISKLASRQPTPGPKRSYCSQCNCTKCKNVNRGSNNPEHYRNTRPFSEHAIQRQPYSDRRPNTSVNPSRLHEAKSHSLSRAMHKGHLSGRSKPSRSKSCVVSRGNFKDRLNKVCSCRKCRLLDQRRKTYKK